MTASARPRKRQRTAIREDENDETRNAAWNAALSTLIERLIAVNADAVALKNEENSQVAEIEETLVTTAAAAKAVAKVIPPPPSEDVDVFSRGVRADSEHHAPDVFKPPPPLPAMKLLMEPDPPEKLIHEQSIIVRAQAINRKNAELARERLPKQPEAQRNKTFHDYFLDEALWMAADFREERKWKMQMARKVSKMIQQYHAQRAQREARAIAEAQNKLIRLANGMARDVRKFWSQIREIADYRSSLAAEAKIVKERMSQLNQLLERTAAYSNGMAMSLKNPIGVGELAEDSESADEAPNSSANGAESESPMQADDVAESVEVPKELEVVSHSALGPGQDSDDYNPQGSGEKGEYANGGGIDDESTMIAAEAEEEKDAAEIEKLQGDATLSVEELLRSQGIDPAVYTADQNKYLNSDDEESLDDSSGEQPKDLGDQAEEAGSPDMEMPMRENDHSGEQDLLQGEKLRSEIKLDVLDALKSQGIAPKAFHADVKGSVTGTDGSRPENGALASLTGNGGVACLRDDLKPAASTYSDQGSNAVPTIHRSASKRSEGENGEETKRPSTVANRQQGSGSAIVTSQRKVPKEPNADGRTMRNDESGTKGDAMSKPQREVGKARRAQKTLPEPSALLRGTLRDYQRDGMTWLTSLYTQKLNGILADEMGLGKTIQTISLLAWLAIEKGVWGPHLIVVPTSVMVNWEMEFKKWLPGFKVLTYFGSLKERKVKRQGWTKLNTFHVCITSYNLAVQDAIPLRRKRWVYLILDEAHNIKNFESQRWQTLLSFPSQRRLLLTGTPLQNSVMELWSLMHFLMPDLFPSQAEFHHWFSKPLAEAEKEEGERNGGKGQIVTRLHEVLRPFILRRLKVDVERGLPPKFEHIVKCPLSKRQRQLYEDFMARSDIRETLHSGDFFSVMNVLMQLRKVCNHPDLFEGRPILSPFSMQPIFYPVPKDVTTVLTRPPERTISLDLLGLNLSFLECKWPGRWHTSEITRISAEGDIRNELQRLIEGSSNYECEVRKERSSSDQIAVERRICFRRSQLRYHAQRTAMRLRQQALLGEDLRAVCTLTPRSLAASIRSGHSLNAFLPGNAPALVRTIEQVADQAKIVSERFVCCITRASASSVEFRFPGDDSMYATLSDLFSAYNRTTARFQALFRPFEVRSRVTIPDKRLVQWDCGKLQVLDRLLRKLKASGSRVLIFTQMTKVLDILESFLNLHTWRYLRLDGTTKTDDRQRIVERFNQDVRIFCMILTTRAGGIGLNLTGADSVVFYDTDYNPAIDNQAQDRAHRIGQTKPVHIYRLVSEQTVEENILRRANEKRTLESLIISEADFTTDAIAGRRKNSPAVQGSVVEFKRSSEPSASKKLAHQPTAVSGRQDPRFISNKRTDASNLTRRNVDDSALPAVETANGYLSGFYSTRDDGKEKATMDSEDDGLLNYQDVTTKLLAAEDDRERIAVFTAAKEQQDLDAEFDDHSRPSEGSIAVEKERQQGEEEPNGVNTEDLILSLTPVQRYALRLIERSRSEESDGEDELSKPTFAPVFSLMSRNSHQEMEKLDKGKRLCPAVDSRDPRTSEDAFDVDDDDDPLFYDFDTSADGRRNYLKALTDTDADIKLYLPLRDGGPEELKVSSVVSGTAAAGLECAEDAAFFPHAYNRMSRTIYSTHRQKERARANLRKRKAEKEAKRKRELELAAAAEKEKDLAAAALAQATKQAIVTDRPRPAKVKADSSRHASGPPSKKMRIEGSVKAKGAIAGSSNVSTDGGLLVSTGLFRKSTKKATKKLQMPNAKASLLGSGGTMPGDGIGLNEGWTRNEDQKVIAAASDFNNNMKLVADAMSLDTSVSAGLRRQRGHQHCLGRLVNSLQKDIKSGPPIPRATVSDADIFRKHVNALVVASKAVEKKPPAWITLPAIPTPWHPSQTKVTKEASNNSKRFQSMNPPTLASVSPLIQVPQHFRIGLKSTETTPQALNRRRFPFLRPPRDEARLGSQRTSTPSHRGGISSQRTGQQAQRSNAASQRARPAATKSNSQAQRVSAQRQNGSRLSSTQVQTGAPNTLPRTITKQGKAPNTAPVVRGSTSNVRSSLAGRGIVQGQGKGEAKAPNPQAHGLSKLGSGVSSARKGVFVPGTSARMNICQVGGAIQNVGKSGQGQALTSAEGRSDIGRKSIVPKQGLTSINLKGSKILSGNTRIPAFVGLGTAGANGVVRPAPPTPLRNGMGSASVRPVYSGESGVVKAKSGTEASATVQGSSQVTAKAAAPSSREEGSRKGAAPPRPTEDKNGNGNKEGETG